MSISDSDICYKKRQTLHMHHAVVFQNIYTCGNTPYMHMYIYMYIYVYICIRLVLY